MSLIDDYSVISAEYLKNIQPYWWDLFRDSFVFLEPSSAKKLDDMVRRRLADIIESPENFTVEGIEADIGTVAYYIAISWLSVGQVEKARVAIDKFGASYPDDPAFHFVNMFLSVIDSDFQSSIEHIEKAISLAPDNAVLAAFGAYLNCLTRDYEKVIRSCNVVLSSNDSRLEYIRFLRYIPFCLLQAETFSGRSSRQVVCYHVLNENPSIDIHLQEISSLLPPIEVVINTCRKNRYYAFVMVDSVYFKKWALSMLMSLDESLDAVTFHVHLVNPDSECAYLISGLERALGNNVIVTTEGNGLTNVCPAATYYVAVRFCRFLQFARQYADYDVYTMLDADLIFNGSLRSFFSNETMLPAFVYFRDEPVWDSLMGGFCVLPKHSVETLLLWISCVILETVKSGRAAWFLDIWAIVLAVKKLESQGGEINYLNPIQFCDLRHRKDSLIWAVTNDKSAFLYGAKNEFYLEKFRSQAGIKRTSQFLPYSLKDVDPYWLHHVEVDRGFVDVDRNEFYARLCSGKKVLHVGCADYPITNIATNLHVYLDQFCDIDGCDTQKEALEMLSDHVAGKLFSNLNEAFFSYDLALVPEVIEHVDDVASFLEALNKVDFRYVVITVPDAYLCSTTHFHYNREGHDFLEFNHPDHNYWFSPYTIRNVIRKYTSWRILKLAFFDRRSILLVAEKVGR